MLANTMKETKIINMSEFTPNDAYRMHHKEIAGDNSEPEVAFDDLPDMAIQMYGVESDLLNARLKEDEQFAIGFVNECLVGSYDEEGTARWWQRARSALGGKTPQEMWAEDRARVIALAKSTAGPTDQS